MILKFIGTASVILFCVFVLVGCGTKNTHPSLTPISIAAFTIEGNCTAQDCAELSQKIKSIKGVTACTVNGSGKIVAVSYQHEKISQTELLNTLNLQTRVIMSQHVFPKQGSACPVHSIQNWF